MWARALLPASLNNLIAEILLSNESNTSWTANRSSHLVVVVPDSIQLYSLLQLLQRGLPRQHYFAVIVNLIGIIATVAR